LMFKIWQIECQKPQIVNNGGQLCQQFVKNLENNKT
jgi:hypothetical protein